ncbi:hypothetical protein FH972_009251 [Carpinus fangiana]|uniref:Uncharacterized protein n=1 Tax=Carpinus fangiana TaxID=176857 RepID=A0A5N6R198_9ROSI|nr:hypothetical protein FH972_009251 [Carpinus fangiana]
MFTTPQKVWSSWSLTPGSGVQKIGIGSGPNSDFGADGKGKSVVATLNSGLVAENGGNNVLVEADGDTEYWPRIFRGFKTRFAGYIWCMVLEFLWVLLFGLLGIVAFSVFVMLFLWVFVAVDFRSVGIRKSQYRAEVEGSFSNFVSA